MVSCFQIHGVYSHSPPSSPPPFPISLTRRQVSQVQPSDVTITSIRNNAQGQLEFVMYIRMAGGSQVLTAGVLEAAIEVWMCLHRVVLSKQFCQLLVKEMLMCCIFSWCTAEWHRRFHQCWVFSQSGPSPIRCDTHCMNFSMIVFSAKRLCKLLSRVNA